MWDVGNGSGGGSLLQKADLSCLVNAVCHINVRKFKSPCACFTKRSLIQPTLPTVQTRATARVGSCQFDLLYRFAALNTQRESLETAKAKGSPEILMFPTVTLKNSRSRLSPRGPIPQIRDWCSTNNNWWWDFLVSNWLFLCFHLKQPKPGNTPVLSIPRQIGQLLPLAQVTDVLDKHTAKQDLSSSAQLHHNA